MKEATGEVSGTVITIIIVAAVLGIATLIFNTNGPMHNWITNLFNSQIGNGNIK